MTSEKLLHALGEIDSELIEEAMPQQPVRSIKRWLKYGSLAAGLVLFCLVGVAVSGMPGADSVESPGNADSLEYSKDASSDYIAQSNQYGSSLPTHTQIIRPNPHRGTITTVIAGDGYSATKEVNINTVAGKITPVMDYSQYSANQIIAAEQETFTQVTGIDFASLVSNLNGSAQIYDLIQIYDMVEIEPGQTEKSNDDLNDTPDAMGSPTAASDDVTNSVGNEILPQAYEILLDSYGVPAYLYVDTEVPSAFTVDYADNDDVASEIAGTQVYVYGFDDGWAVDFEHRNLSYHLEIYGLNIDEVLSVVNALLR